MVFCPNQQSQFRSHTQNRRQPFGHPFEARTRFHLISHTLQKCNVVRRDRRRDEFVPFERGSSGRNIVILKLPCSMQQKITPKVLTARIHELANYRRRAFTLQIP